MSREEIKGTIEKILIDHEYVYPEDEVHENHSYFDDYGMDSVDFLEFIWYIESKYGISIPDYAAERMDTVARTIDYLHLELN